MPRGPAVQSARAARVSTTSARVTPSSRVATISYSVPLPLPSTDVRVHVHEHAGGDRQRRPSGSLLEREDVPAEALEAAGSWSELEAGERREVEVAVVVVLAVPRERPLALLLGERIGREVEPRVEEAGRTCLAPAHGIATARPTTEPSRSRR